MLRSTTVKRLEGRVEQLLKGFPGYVNAFATAKLFTGPSLHFHERTLQHLRDHRSAVRAVRDEHYLEALYATLTAWGMHRMGPGNTKLIGFSEFCRTLAENGDQAAELEEYCILDPVPSEVTRRLYSLAKRVRISPARTYLVSSSKVLHHLLPKLVPPIDNEYTLSFFLHSVILNGDNDESVLATIFPYFNELGQAQASFIRGLVGHGYMNTSASKVLDNGIVGYCLKHAV